MAENVRATIEEGSYPLWILKTYGQATGKTDRPALEYILERWARVDPDAAELYGVTLARFQQERAHDKVSQIDKKRAAKGETA